MGLGQILPNTLIQLKKRACHKAYCKQIQIYPSVKHVFSKTVLGVKFSKPWEEFMFLMTKAWKQKVFDFCCWTGRHT